MQGKQLQFNQNIRSFDLAAESFKSFHYKQGILSHHNKGSLIMTQYQTTHMTNIGIFAMFIAWLNDLCTVQTIKGPYKCLGGKLN